MFRQRFDLPLGDDGSGRFVPWIVALMVYLASLSLGAGIAASGAVRSWDAGLEGAVTIEIVPAADAERTDARVREVLQLLRTTAGIASAEAIAEDRVAALLEPWIDRGELPADLPIPRLIDVRLLPGTPLDLDAVAREVAAMAPGARLDDHQVWLSRLAALGRTVQLASGFIVALVSGAAAGTVIFATRAGLAVHREVIEVMHLIGARDSYVARQFQAHAMSLALRGGLLGATLGAATLAVFVQLAGPLEGPRVPAASFGTATWATVIALPLLAAAIATVTARFTVLRTLRRML